MLLPGQKRQHQWVRTELGSAAVHIKTPRAFMRYRQAAVRVACRYKEAGTCCNTNILTAELEIPTSTDDKGQLVLGVKVNS
jgi:hypothetical protein